MDVTAVVATLTALVTALAGLVPSVIWIWKRLSAQERRLERFWRARLLRGTAEALTARYVVEQIGPESIDPDQGGFMPVALSQEAYSAYEPIADKLKEMYKKYQNATDTEFAEAIEDRFGAWLARFVCAVLGISNYACLVMAMAVARGTPVAVIPPDSKRHKAV